MLDLAFLGIPLVLSCITPLQRVRRQPQIRAFYTKVLVQGMGTKASPFILEMLPLTTLIPMWNHQEYNISLMMVLLRLNVFTM